MPVVLDRTSLRRSASFDCLFARRLREGRRDLLCYNANHRRPFTRQLQHIGAPLNALESGLESDNLATLRCLRRWALDQSLPVYLVGGPVRDVLLGTSVKDLDFVVEGDGPRVARQLAEELGGEVVVHDRFGTSTFLKGRSRVDLVTARSEVYPQPAALPQVSSGVISEDLARRDFSINAMALPLGMNHPEILDPHGGVEDLELGQIRVLHSASFIDDPTRIFRAVRYEQRFGFKIEASTQDQLRDSIKQGHLAALSSDRLRHELERILEEDHPEGALNRVLELGALGAIHSSFGDGNAAARLNAVAGLDPSRRESPGAGVGPLVYIGALTYSLSRADVEKLIERLNMPRPWTRTVRDVMELQEREQDIAAPNLRDSGLVPMVKDLCAEAVFAVSLLTDSRTVAHRLSQYLNELRYAAPALDGNDLLALGVPAGPMVGRILQQLQEARLDRQVLTEEDERRLVEQILNRQEEQSEHA